MSTGKRSKDDGKTKMYKVVKENPKKKKKSDIVSNQMPLFDANEYTDESLKKGRTRR